jgi:chorismate synthase
MTHLRFFTGGESHGPCVTAFLEGVPSGLALTRADVDVDLARRQLGAGRGARQKIERDRIEFLGGVRHGRTLGGPVVLRIENLDWANWTHEMSPDPPPDPLPEGAKPSTPLTRPRPGHADLAGLVKHAQDDVRDVWERSSARETAGRVAAGAVARTLLARIGVRIRSHVVDVGGERAEAVEGSFEDLAARAEASPVRSLDPEAEARMLERIEWAGREGDSVGGVVEVVAEGAPPGLGSFVQWDRKLDARLAAALFSIQAVKGVEVGLGFGVAAVPGTEAHDEILPAGDLPAEEARATGGFRRPTNRAGGIEGGMSNGLPIVVRAAVKPIATLRKALRSVDVRTGEPAAGQVLRTDVCVVAPAAVVAEAATALVLADAALEKFGGDSMGELERNVTSYLASIRVPPAPGRAGR